MLLGIVRLTKGVLFENCYKSTCFKCKLTTLPGAHMLSIDQLNESIAYEELSKTSYFLYFFSTRMSSSTMLQKLQKKLKLEPGSTELDIKLSECSPQQPLGLVCLFTPF